MDTLTDDRTLSPELERRVTRLRRRDADPKYADAPVLDAYARISKSPDTGDLEKTDRQLADILDNISRRHARLGAVLRDDNKSAFRLNAKRPDFLVLKQRLTSGASDGVVCWHTDRLMRQPRDLEDLIDLSRKRGVLVASCHGDYDLSSDDAQFTLGVLTNAARKESAAISRRQRRKHEALRAEGSVTAGGRSFGFPSSPKSKFAAVSDEQVQAEREAIRWAVEAHIDGMAIRAITREWNSRGLRTSRDGKLFTPEQVRMIVKRARNAGLIEHDGRILGRIKWVTSKREGEEPEEFTPIITEEQFHAVRALFTARKRGRPASERYLLSGLARCAQCGAAMSGHQRNYDRRPSDKARRYRCHPTYGCNRVGIDANQAEAWVRNEVIRVLSSPKHARAIARQSAELAKVERRIAEVERTSVGLAERLGTGRMSLDEYDAASGPLRTRLAGLRAERDALAALGSGREAHARNRTDVAAEWDMLAESNDTEALRAMVREALPHGIAVRPAIARGPASKAADRLSVL